MDVAVCHFDDTLSVNSVSGCIFTFEITMTFEMRLKFSYNFDNIANCTSS